MSQDAQNWVFCDILNKVALLLEAGLSDIFGAMVPKWSLQLVCEEVRILLEHLFRSEVNHASLTVFPPNLDIP